MPVISQRGINMPESPIRKLAPLANEAKARGIKVYHLNIGQPDIPTPEVGLDALRRIDRKVLSYCPSDGLQSLRQKMTEYYRRFAIDVTPEEIFITTGASEAVSLTFLACLDPGDEILIPEPAYANYMSMAMSCGAVVKTVPSSIDNGFALPPIEAFEEAITPRTKAVLLCNPNNPTGYVYTREELGHIRDLVRRHDLFLFSDEVYREFTYDGEKFTSLGHMKDVLDRVVMIDSVSKRFSACGARIGCIAIKNKDFMAQVLKLCQARLCVSTLEQIGAAGLYKTPKKYLEDVNREYKARRDTLYKALKSMDGVICEEPKGAFYVMVKAPVDDAEKFIVWMLQNFDIDGETTMAAPGNGFYTAADRGRNEMRLAYVLKNEDLVKAMTILKGALAAYPGRVEAIRA